MNDTRKLTCTKSSNPIDSLIIQCDCMDLSMVIMGIIVGGYDRINIDTIPDQPSQTLDEKAKKETQ